MTGWNPVTVTIVVTLVGYLFVAIRQSYGEGRYRQKIDAALEALAKHFEECKAKEDRQREENQALRERDRRSERRILRRLQPFLDDKLYRDRLEDKMAGRSPRVRMPEYRGVDDEADDEDE